MGLLESLRQLLRSTGDGHTLLRTRACARSSDSVSDIAPGPRRKATCACRGPTEVACLAAEKEAWEQHPLTPL